MADEPDNHTLRLLREMREENERLHTETREENREMREENERQHAQTRSDLLHVIETVSVMAKAVNAMHEDLRDLRRGQAIIEMEMRGIRGRVERIEDRLDKLSLAHA